MPNEFLKRNFSKDSQVTKGQSLSREDEENYQHFLQSYTNPEKDQRRKRREHKRRDREEYLTS